MQDLRIGVIGSGGRGVIASEAHLPGKGSAVVACCDSAAGVGEQNRASYGKELFFSTDYRELLGQELDAVFIMTPDFLHEEMATQALLAGKAVYLEKPMAITTAGCDRILAAGRTSGSRLFVGHNMRHMTYIRRMKSMIDAGAVGRVRAIWCRHFVGNGGDYYFKDWHAEARYSTGLLLQKGAHDIDVIHWLAGSYAQRVHGFGGLKVYGDNADKFDSDTVPPGRAHNAVDVNDWPPSSLKGINGHVDVEDISMMEMVMDNGVLASYQQCHFTPDYWRNYTVIGDEGRLENFGNGGDGTCIKLWNQRKAGHGAPDAIEMISTGTLTGHGGSDSNIISAFLKFVREGGATDTSPVGARYSVAAGCAATHSIRHGGIVVDVPAVDAQLDAYFKNQQKPVANNLPEPALPTFQLTAPSPVGVR